MSELSDAQYTRVLDHVSAGEIPKVYRRLREYLFDFYAGFGFGDQTVHDVVAFLDDRRFPQVQRFFVRNYGYDLRFHLMASIEEIPVDPYAEYRRYEPYYIDEPDEEEFE